MQISMTVLFPLTFASNVFVDPATMPGWVQAFVEGQPDQPPGDGVARASCTATSTPPPSGGCSCGRAALLVVFAPLTMRRYNRA